MRVSILADLPGCSIATNSTCTTKLEHFDEIWTHGKSNFGNEFLEMIFQPLEKVIIYEQIWSIEFFEETTVHSLQCDRSGISQWSTQFNTANRYALESLYFTCSAPPPLHLSWCALLPFFKKTMIALFVWFETVINAYGKGETSFHPHTVTLTNPNRYMYDKFSFCSIFVSQATHKKLDSIKIWLHE